MIISKTPFRMSFFGGGTDVPDYFMENEGAVISSTFNKYCYVSVRNLPDFFEHKNQINYSEIERTKCVEEIKHPLIRETMKYLKADNLIINYDADLPARSGLGTSSSFAVGLINSILHMERKNVSKMELAKKAILIERDICKEDGGWQDQVAAAYGGLNKISFNKNGFSIKKINVSDSFLSSLNNHLMLFFTGFTRMSFEIQKVNKKKSKSQIESLNSIKAIVEYAENCFSKGQVEEIGRLLDYSWDLKKKSANKMSNDIIDEAYSIAKRNGAIGGKLLGAGGGGFMIIFANPQYHKAIREGLKSFVEVPFKFEDKGSEIIFNSTEV